MDRLDFKNAVNELFKDFEIRIRWNDMDPNDYWINKENGYLIYFRKYVFCIYNNITNELIYEYNIRDNDDYVKMYDELLICKELILPKYL